MGAGSLCSAVSAPTCKRNSATAVYSLLSQSQITGAPHHRHPAAVLCPFCCLGAELWYSHPPPPAASAAARWQQLHPRRLVFLWAAVFLRRTQRHAQPCSRAPSAHPAAAAAAGADAVQRTYLTRSSSSCCRSGSNRLVSPAAASRPQQSAVALPAQRRELCSRPAAAAAAAVVAAAGCC